MAAVSPSSSMRVRSMEVLWRSWAAAATVGGGLTRSGLFLVTAGLVAPAYKKEIGSCLEEAALVAVPSHWLSYWS
jgi:hypothetical protein